MNHKIYAEASEWLLEFRGGRPDRALRERFERWLCTSPEHVRAYLEQSAVWETIHSQPAAEPAELEALVERARQALPENVVLLGATAETVPQVPPVAEPQSQWFRRAWPALAATVLLAIAGVTLYLQSPRHVYSTGTGEQRSILLADGSTIDLNARSSVRVRFDSRGRHVDLIEGQALFRVAKDARRPFIVAANGTRVRAVGTQFDINQRRDVLVVTVVEGTVAVSGSLPLDGAGTASPSQAQSVPVPSSSRTHSPIVPRTGEILLDAGEQLTLAAAATLAPSVKPPATPHSVDVESATAWTHRRLIFDTTPLEDVAAEFNRNSDRPIVVESRGLEDFHVSGAFSSTDVGSFLRFLRAQNGVEVIEEPDRIVITRR
jgi:transmembrane sensor